MPRRLTDSFIGWVHQRLLLIVLFALKEQTITWYRLSFSRAHLAALALLSTCFRSRRSLNFTKNSVDSWHTTMYHVGLGL